MRFALVALMTALACASAGAADNDVYLLSPTVVEGERQIDSHSGLGTSGPAVARESDSTLAVGMALSEHWFSEIGLRYARIGGGGTSWNGVAWENVLQLAEPGEWPVDVGLTVEVETSRRAADGTTLLVGPLLQKEFFDLQANFNLLFSRVLGSGTISSTQIEYQAQLKYRYRQPLEFGVQAFGRISSATDSWAAMSEQQHLVGPVVLGQVLLPRERALAYNAAYLIGTTAHSADRVLRLQVEYDF